MSLSNPQQYMNDLGGFRNQIGRKVEEYKNKQDLVNSTVGKLKSKALQKAQDVMKQGQSLVNTAYESQGGAAALKVLGKGGTKAVTWAKGKVQDKIAQRLASREGGASNTGNQQKGIDTKESEAPQELKTKGDIQDRFDKLDESNSKDEIQNRFDRLDDKPGARDNEGIEMSENPGQGADMAGAKSAEQSAAQGTAGSESKTQTSFEQSSGGSESLENSQGGMLSREGTPGAGETAGQGDGAAAVTKVDAEGGVNDAENVVKDVTRVGAVTAEEDGIVDVAAATSWIPIIGEIMAGAAAVAGIAVGVDGLVEAAQGGSMVKKAEAMPDAAPQKPSAVNVAGTYVTPTRSSLSV